MQDVRWMTELVVVILTAAGVLGLVQFARFRFYSALNAAEARGYQAARLNLQAFASPRKSELASFLDGLATSLLAFAPGLIALYMAKMKERAAREAAAAADDGPIPYDLTHKADVEAAFSDLERALYDLFKAEPPPGSEGVGRSAVPDEAPSEGVAAAS